VGDYANTIASSRNFVGDFVGNYARTLPYSRTVSATYNYSVSPKFYWLEGPEGWGEGDFMKVIDVWWDGARVASQTVPSFSSITYISSGGMVYHKGNLSNTVGQRSNYYSITRNTSTSAPSATTSYYTRWVPYSRTSTRTSSRAYAIGGQFARTRATTFARLISYTGTNTLGYTGNYTGNFVSNAVRTESYVGDFLSPVSYFRFRSTHFVGNYTGLNIIIEGGEPRTVNSIRDRVSSYIGNYLRNESYSRTRVVTYSGVYTRPLTYSANYVGNYGRNIVDSYSGIYSQTFTGNYIGNYARTRTQGVKYARTFTGYYTRTFVGERTSTTMSTSTRTRIATITRPSSYTRPAYYAGNFAGNYTRTRIGSRSSTLSFSRNLYFIGNYIGNYGRTSTRGSTRSSTFTRTSVYTGNYVGDFTTTTNSTSESIVKRTSSYTRPTSSASTRNISSGFVGNYIGNYTSQSTRTPTNTSEIGWQGEKFVIELRGGSDTTPAQGALTALASKEFTLLDNDAGTFVTMSPQILHHTASPEDGHELEFDFYTEGSSTVVARLYRDNSIIVNSFNLVSNQRNTLTVNDVPPEGTTYTYTLQVFNGNAWILGTYYQVTTVSNTDYATPVITLVGANPQSVDLNATYQELGASTDTGETVDIDATEVNTASVGSYIVTYNANGATQVTRTVNVVPGNTSPGDPGDGGNNGGNPNDNIN